MTETERAHNDEEIGRLRHSIVHPQLTVKEKVLRWLGAVALVVSLVTFGYTYVSQQAYLACQATILQNGATQDAVGSKLSGDFRQFLRDQQAALDKVIAGVAAGNNSLVVSGITEYSKVTDAYIEKSETAAKDRAKNPTTFTC